jgi:hypothetical protein
VVAGDLRGDAAHALAVAVVGGAAAFVFGADVSDQWSFLVESLSGDSLFLGSLLLLALLVPFFDLEEIGLPVCLVVFIDVFGNKLLSTIWILGPL